jgi:hypothetical protein
LLRNQEREKNSPLLLRAFRAIFRISLGNLCQRRIRMEKLVALSTQYCMLLFLSPAFLLACTTRTILRKITDEKNRCADCQRERSPRKPTVGTA